MLITYLKIFIGKTEYLGGWLSVGPPRSRCQDGWNAQENFKGYSSQRKWGSNHDGHRDGRLILSEGERGGSKIAWECLRSPCSLYESLLVLSGVLEPRLPIRSPIPPRNWPAQPPCHSWWLAGSSHGECSFSTEIGGIFRGHFLGIPIHRSEMHILMAIAC